MTPQILEKPSSTQEQRLLLPGWHSWQEFKAIQTLMEEVPGVRLTYLDGFIELMTIGEPHELLKKAISILLEVYFFEMGIEFVPVGSATREVEGQKVSFEPDESYYIGGKGSKEHPDLAIEVIITSGNIKKLAKYKRLEISEVWFWEDNSLSLYRWREQDYEAISRSEFLPKLNIDLLVRCVLMPSRLEARNEFLKGIQR
ncbi:Uma2 family endonuclease [Phormidium sp. FACHB-592]|uniref:Uma2 family endonuclease n=1 Tax=Stenomitos frigidus AS-A4 TaxID=2933935 RepID=A0ABV0KFF9_9CYAN|nr:Uma2 family endonuclease [Phormidium sp. FACHB-592]MBD2076571.1 Uma2 family endonuclease [Phormidium sp. FACHB-592]